MSHDTPEDDLRRAQWRAAQLEAEIAALRARLEAAEQERDRLREWRDSVSSAIKTVPEFHTGEWGGDKEGWGFHFEIVNWLRRTKEAAEAALQAERERNAPLRARIKGIQDQHDREMAPLRKRLDDRTRAAEFRRQMIREWYRRYRKVESERAWAKARERRLAEAARPIAAYLSETDRLAGLKRSEVRELIAALAEHDAAKGE